MHPPDASVCSHAPDEWRELIYSAVAGGADAAPAGDPLTRWADAVDRTGRPARVVRVSRRDFDELPLPTLVQKRNGDLALLSSRTSRGFNVLERGGGARFVPRARVEDELGDIALDLSPGLPSEGGLLRRLASAGLGERGLGGKVVATSALLVVFGVLAPMITAWVVDRALPESDRALLVVLVIAAFVLRVHKEWLQWLRSRATLALEGALEGAVLRSLPAHLLRLPYAVASRCNVGAMLESLDASASGARMLVGSGLLPLVDAAFALLFLVLLALHAPIVAVAAIGLTMCSSVVTASLAGKMDELRRVRLQASEEARSSLFELVSGVLGIRAAGAEPTMFSRWLGRFLTERGAELTLGRFEASFDGWIELAHKAARIATFFWCGHSVIVGELSLGAFLACTSYTDGYISSAHKFLRSAVPLTGAHRDAARADAYLQLATAPGTRSQGRPRQPGTEDAIVFDDVWFRYDADGPWILQSFNLRVRAGEVYKLAGASGAGKTTILRLIAGLLTPERGCVRVAGRDPVHWRGNVAYLPQEPHLFSGSILSNLRLLSGAGYDRITMAAKLTGLQELLATLPMGLETVLPPGGTTLSGGQRQLVLLTAAVASERPVVLLDESLAHLDGITRHTLLSCPSFRDRTVVTVEHSEPDAGRIT